MQTDHLAVIEEELTSFAGHLEDERDGWKEGSDAYKRYCAQLGRIDAALAAVRQEREGGAWQPLDTYSEVYADASDGHRYTIGVDGEDMIYIRRRTDKVVFPLPDDIRLCRRTPSPASQQATPATTQREEALEIELRDAIFDILYSSSLPPDKRSKWHARMEELEPAKDATDKQQANDNAL